MHALPRPLRWPPTFPLQKGLVCWLPFDERSGAALRDRSGKGNHGTLSGCTWIAGGRGSALRFNGTSDNVSLSVNVFDPYFSGVAHSGSIVWSAKFDAVAAALDMVNIEGAIIVRHDISGKIGGFATGTSADQALTPLEYDDGNRHHYAFTWTTLLQSLYVDGLLVVVDVPVALYDLSLLNRASAVGAGFDGSFARFKGDLFRVSVYSRALNAAEIKREHESELMLARH